MRTRSFRVPNEAHYGCVCDEVGKSEGSIEFEVPDRETDGHSGKE